jgi:NADPH:quinone reductase-like Zn-dependent oxidoreductase
MLNDWALPKMSDLGTKCAGHEGAGVIVKVGDQVKNLKPGMRAGYKVSSPLYATLQNTMGTTAEINRVRCSC